jgi:hypothetical protein
MAFNHAREPLALAGTDHIDAFADSESFHCHFVTDVHVNYLGTEFPKESQWGDFPGFEVTQLTTRQSLGMEFTKAQLDRRIALFFRSAYLRNVTWPSFDDCHGMRDALLIEDLGHADLLANQPFQHLNFLLHKFWFETVSPGLDCIISETAQSIVQTRRTGVFGVHVKDSSCAVFDLVVS